MMKKIVGFCLFYLSIYSIVFSQVDTAYIFNQSMPYGTLDLRLSKSATRYYYLQEDVTFSFRESSPGVRTNTFADTAPWDSNPFKQGNMREVSGSSDMFVMNYRLMFPENYNASFSPGYPIIMMMHGAGETGNCWNSNCYWATPAWNPITNNPPAPTTGAVLLLNNDRNLFHGGQMHIAAVKLAGGRLPNDPSMPSRAFPGFVLHPQNLIGWNNPNTVEDAIRILRLLMNKYNIDENRVYIHGLSNGGAAVLQALKRAPWLFAAALPMSAVNDGEIVNQGMAAETGKVPVWWFQGGQDTNPPPGRTFYTIKKMRDAGADVRYYMYPSIGHGTWNNAYNEPDFFTWMLSKKKTNPHVFYGNPVICNTTGAGVRMGFTKGFRAYQWEKDGQIISGATSAEYTASSPGTYRGRISRKPNPAETDWEPWSDPITVREASQLKPSIEVTGSTHLRGPSNGGSNAENTVTLRASQKADLYEWYRNGVLIDIPGTNLDDTLRTVSFTSYNSTSNGEYTLITKDTYCPSPPSDPVNLFFMNSAPQDLLLTTAMDFQGIATSPSSAILTWRDESNSETGYEIWRRKSGTTDFKFVIKTAKDAVSHLDTGLEPSTLYDYKIRAINNSGRSNYVPSDALNTNLQVTTLADETPPDPPQNLVVVSNNINTIRLSWQAATDNAGIKEYVITYGSSEISTGDASTTYTLTGLPPSNVYPITVRARDFAGHLSQPSNQVTGTTYVTSLSYKHSTGSWADLDEPELVATWSSPEFVGTVSNFSLAPRTQEDFFNFQFTGYLRITTGGTYTFNTTSDDGSRLILNGVMLVDNDGKHGKTTVTSQPITLEAGLHSIEVQFFEAQANQYLSVQYSGPDTGGAMIDIPDVALKTGDYSQPAQPSPPSGLTATGTGMQEISLSWQFSDDSSTDFEVHRATDAAGPFAMVGRSATISLKDQSYLKPGKTYYYKVRTVNANGASEFTSVVSTATLPDNVVPSVPSELKLINKTATEFTFSWAASTDNVAVTGYEIYTNGSLTGTSSIPFFVATGLPTAQQYAFTVIAIDGNGNRSAMSSALVVVNDVCPDVSVLEPEVIACTGTAATLHASGSTGSYKWYDAQQTEISNATGDSYTTPPVSQQMTFYVAAVHASGCVSTKKSIQVTTDNLATPVITMRNDTLYSSPHTNYQWRKDDQDIEGAQLQFYKPIAPGNYTVVTTQGACKKESVPYIFISSGNPGNGSVVVAISPDHLNSFNIDVYPVPNHGKWITVKAVSPTYDVVHLRLVGVDGKQIFIGHYDITELRQGVTLTASSETLPDGIYILMARQGKTEVRRRIVVRK